MPKAKKLSKRYELFCTEYIKLNLNGSRAAIAAGYSTKTANATASRLLTKDNIKARVSELISERSKSTQVDARYVLMRLKEIDELDVADILNEDGSMMAIKEWPKAWRISISGLDISEMIIADIRTVVKKIKWPDKLKNLELLGRHVDIKAWDKDPESTSTDGLANAVSKLIDKLPN